MKKFISIITIFSLLAILAFTTNIYAASLDALTVDTDKTTVEPGAEVKVTINFGQELGTYTFDVAYDNNLFEYVSVDGGTANDMTNKVRVVFHDSTGGSNPRRNMSVTFKAKSDITTSNPTEFLVTGEGLSNADTSVTYDDISIPIVKNVTVEPRYVDYELKLEYTGDIIEEKEKAMKLSYSSPMGHHYEHARLIAEATTPKDGKVKLLATDSQGLEHDIIESGWGDAQGYAIGGKNVEQVLDVRALFSEEGEYTITLKLIDRDNSDTVISEKSFKMNVKDDKEIINKEENVTTEKEEEKKPTKLPKTGIDIYAPIALILALLTGSYIYYNKRK